MNHIATLGVELYAQFRDRPTNLCLSPFSIWLALGLLQPGARGRTREELDGLLGADATSEARTLRETLAERAQGCVVWDEQDAANYGFNLRVANNVWVQTGYPLQRDYCAALERSFGVVPASLDFGADPGTAASEINQWVSAQTEARIEQIISRRVLGPLTRLVLANAVYFKAAWCDEFHEHGTRVRPFYLSSGEQVEAWSMSSIRDADYADVDGVQLISLPYVRRELELAVILPPRGHFEPFDRGLTAQTVQVLLDRKRQRNLDIALPRFTFETSMELTAQLGALGVVQALSPSADLGGISTEPGVNLSQVLHKTFLDVNEKGTEAAAVTAIVMAGCAPGEPPKPIPFHVDSPFYMLIRDVPTNTWLFFARVLDPRD